MPSAAASAEHPLPRLQRVEGHGCVSTQLGGGRTRVARLFQEGAAKIRLPHTHDRSLEAVLMNTAGGLTGGDRLAWRASAAPATHLVLTTPACERIYRAGSGEAAVDIHLAAGPGARLDWLPQETILFERARLRRRLDVDLEGDATLLAAEAVLLGRAAMGERAEFARLDDGWRVRRDGRLIHAEATRLGAGPDERESLSLLAGAAAFATLLYLGPDLDSRQATLATLPDDPGLGISRLEHKLVVRALAPSGIALRRLIVPIIALLSGSGRVPRLWTF